MSNQDEDEKTAIQTVGCAAIIWSVLVVMPLFYSCMFFILDATGAPIKAWVCFWLYVMASVLGLVIKEVFGFMMRHRKLNGKQ